MRRTPRRLVIIAAVLGSVAVCAGWAAGTGMTLGQAAASTTCTTGVDFIAVQTGTSGGASYTIPSGRWAITSWSAAGGPPGAEALVVFRPTGTRDQYKVVGSTPPHELQNSMNTFRTAIKVKGGDLVGFWVKDGTTCALSTGSGSDTVSLGPANGIPTAGTTVTLMPFISGYQLNMKVTLASRPAPS